MTNQSEDNIVEDITQRKHNPLMDRFNAMPPETFRLPSGGTLYTNGELDPEVVNGEVIVYPMTTIDEISMRSPDMLYQGSSVEAVFNRCIPQVKKPMDLLSNDVDYLLICLRIITYGENLDIYWKCPECHDEDGKPIKTSHDVDSDDDRDINVSPTYTINLNKFLRETKTLNHSVDRFKVPLPTGEVVKLRPTSFRDMLKLYQYDPTNLTTPEELFEFVSSGIMAVIENVNNVTDRGHIAEWIRACEAPILTKLQSEIHTANDWGTSFDYTFECSDCGHTSTGEVPLNPVHFFTSPSVVPIKV